MKPLRRWVWASGVTQNTRDLGGYACDGGVTRFGLALRSDQLVGLTRPEMDRFLQCGLSDVIDLRSVGERRRLPNAFENCPSVLLHTVKVGHDENEFQFSPYDFHCMGEIYQKLADANGAEYARMLGILAEARGLCVIHCMAGKDRTGIVCALLLSLLGVAQCDIVADYQLSYTYLEQRTIRNFATDLDPNLPRYLYRSDPENMWMLLNHLKQKYGGAETYLLRNGLNEETMRVLRAKLIAEE